MKISFCMYGPNLNACDFLLKAQHIPEKYSLYEDEQIMVEEADGFTLHFCDTSGFASIPFSFGRFVLANRSILNDKKVIGEDTKKELEIVVRGELLDEDFLRNGVIMFLLTPKTMKLLSDLNIHLCLTKA